MSKQVTFIETYKNALPDEMCNWAISEFDYRMENDLAQVGMTYTGYNLKWKDSWEVVLNFYDHLLQPTLNYIENNTLSYIEKYTEKYKIIDKNRKEDKENIVFPTEDWRMKRYISADKQGYHIFHTDFSLNSISINRGIAVMYYLNDNLTFI